MVMAHPVQYSGRTGILARISLTGRDKGVAWNSPVISRSRAAGGGRFGGDLVAGVSGYVVASQIPPTYEAETQLLVGPYNTDRDTPAASGDLVQTYSQLVTTTPLLTQAINETGRS